jgi:hypothetical protein
MLARVSDPTAAAQAASNPFAPISPGGPTNSSNRRSSTPTPGDPASSYGLPSRAVAVVTTTAAAPAAATTTRAPANVFALGAFKPKSSVLDCFFEKTPNPSSSSSSSSGLTATATTAAGGAAAQAPASAAARARKQKPANPFPQWRPEFSRPPMTHPDFSFER